MDIISKVQKTDIEFKHKKPLDLYMQISHLDRYHEWRLAIYERDKLRCQHCGRQCRRKTVFTDSEKDLPIAEAHRRKLKIKHSIKKYKITLCQQVLSIPEFWDLDNGVTLCRPCRKSHANYPFKKLIDKKALRMR